jgi:hypothetical protein
MRIKAEIVCALLLSGAAAAGAQPLAAGLAAQGVSGTAAAVPAVPAPAPARESVTYDWFMNDHLCAGVDAQVQLSKKEALAALKPCVKSVAGTYMSKIKIEDTPQGFALIVGRAGNPLLVEGLKAELAERGNRLLGYQITLYTTTAARSRTAAVRLSCTGPGRLALEGTLDENGGEFTLADPGAALGIDFLTAQPEEVWFERYIRENEESYASAKYYSYPTEWDSFSFSLPRTALAGQAGGFPAHVTVYADDNDEIVQGKSVELSCRVN